MVYCRYTGVKGAEMYSSYMVEADELTEGFLTGLKETYGKKKINILVYEVEDETEYLLKDEANRKHLLEAVAADKAGNSYRAMNVEELESMLI
jgi:hypothetical protein